MKSKRYIFIILSFISILLTGCNKGNGPEEVFEQYARHWEKQEFSAMWQMHTGEAKELAEEKEFTGRYEKIYTDLHVQDVKITVDQEFEKPEKGAKTVTIPFQISMNTIAGPITFEEKAKLVKTEKNDETGWLVDWHPGFIFPGMESGDRVKLEMTPASRGEILDRNGQGLAVNGDVYEIGIIPRQIEGQENQVKKELVRITGIPKGKIDEALNVDWVQPDYFVPVGKLPDTEQNKVEKLQSIPGVQVRKTTARVYPLGEAAAHLIGYVGEVTADDLEKNKNYTPGDVIGKRGLEQLFEEKLKGENGAVIYIEKEDGTTSVIAERPVENGESIELTIDSELQKLMSKTFNGTPGTGAALNPKTGEVLALVSSPSFDPDLYMFLPVEKKKALEEDPEKPLLNRFLYPHTPGSVMKPFTAAVALKNGVITPEKTMDIKTKKWQKDDSWGGYHVVRVKDPGKPVNLKDALVYSDNIYFAMAALDLGEKQFITGLKEFGFQEKIPFAYPLKPSQISNDGKLSDEILLADSAYGQGEVQTNIVHLASGYTAFINKGDMIQPVLLKSEEKSRVWKEKVISEKHADIIDQYLRHVVRDQDGTGHLANMKGLPLSGKTGTAEAGKTAQGKRAKENGWFVAYTTDDKDLLIAMTMEGIEKEDSGIVVRAVKDIFTGYKK